MSHHSTGHSYAQTCAERDDRRALQVGRACDFSLNGGWRRGYVIEIDGEWVTVATFRDDRSAYMTIRSTAQGEVLGPLRGSLESVSMIPASLRERAERRLGYSMGVAA